MTVADGLFVLVCFIALVALIAGAVWLDHRARQRRAPDRVVDGRGEA